jgi:hypothetical protein
MPQQLSREKKAFWALLSFTGLPVGIIVGLTFILVQESKLKLRRDRERLEPSPLIEKKTHIIIRLSFRLLLCLVTISFVYYNHFNFLSAFILTLCWGVPQFPAAIYLDKL